jgi:prophage antirepressor-like protein
MGPKRWTKALIRFDRNREWQGAAHHVCIASAALSGNTTIRVVTLDGNPWFVAKDTTDVLGLLNVNNACRPLNEDEKRTVTRTTNRELFSLGRGSSRLILISESGLYKLIMRSDKPEARTFQDWVTREVLPAIRKDGGYSGPTNPVINAKENE